MNANTAVKNYLETLKPEVIFNAHEVYAEQFFGSQISAPNFYKILERHQKKGDIQRLVKGYYYRPRKTAFGLITLNEEKIIEWMLSKFKGIEIGYGLYNSKKITTQRARKRKFLISNMRFESSTIGENTFNRINLKLNQKIGSLIEVLDILENIDFLEDVNKHHLDTLFKENLKEYTDQTLEVVMKAMLVKKFVLARLAQVLDHLEVENKVKINYLSELSNYKLIDWIENS